MTSELCGFWAAAARRKDGTPLVDVVAGPTTGGIVLAFETARQLGVRGIFAEEVRDADGTTHREFRRGFRIEPGERVLLVDDILTTGGSLLAMVPAVEAAGGEIVACFVMADRSGGTAVLVSPTTGPPVLGAGALAARDPDVRAGPRRPARAAPTARRCTRRGARGRPPADAGRRTPEDSAADARRPPGRWRDRRITARAARVHAAGRPPLAPRAGTPTLAGGGTRSAVVTEPADHQPGWRPCAEVAGNAGHRAVPLAGGDRRRVRRLRGAHRRPERRRERRARGGVHPLGDVVRDVGGRRRPRAGDRRPLRHHRARALAACAASWRSRSSCGVHRRERPDARGAGGRGGACRGRSRCRGSSAASAGPHRAPCSPRWSLVVLGLFPDQEPALYLTAVGAGPVRGPRWSCSRPRLLAWASRTASGPAELPATEGRPPDRTPSGPAGGAGESRGLACRPALDGAGLTAYGRDRREAPTRGPCTGRRDRAEPLARPTRGCVP